MNCQFAGKQVSHCPRGGRGSTCSICFKSACTMAMQHAPCTCCKYSPFRVRLFKIPLTRRRNKENLPGQGQTSSSNKGTNSREVLGGSAAVITITERYLPGSYLNRTVPIIFRLPVFEQSWEFAPPEREERERQQGSSAHFGVRLWGRSSMAFSLLRASHD